MSEDWLNRWANGRIGWHEAEGNAGLKEHWPVLPTGAESRKRVLVPLCGKSLDLLWLLRQGLEVVGVELSETAVRQFYAENAIEFYIESGATLDAYVAKSLPLRLYCGDYFAFTDSPFDALYDRGAIVALPLAMRAAYIEHTQNLLVPGAIKMIITLEYEQSVVQGPPFSMNADELKRTWPELKRVAEHNDIDNCPPKFRAAGLEEITEVVWLAS